MDLLLPHSLSSNLLCLVMFNIWLLVEHTLQTLNHSRLFWSCIFIKNKLNFYRPITIAVAILNQTKPNSESIWCAHELMSIAHSQPHQPRIYQQHQNATAVIRAHLARTRFNRWEICYILYNTYHRMNAHSNRPVVWAHQVLFRESFLFCKRS